MSGAYRELIAELFVSLDGYAFGAKAGPYFDLYGPELGELLQQRLAEPQELLVGRRTYQMLGAMAGSPEGTDPSARGMDELAKTVLSHEASLPLPWTPARVVGGELPEVIGRLKSEPGPMLRMIGSVTVVVIWRPLSCWTSSAWSSSRSCWDQMARSRSSRTTCARTWIWWTAASWTAGCWRSTTGRSHVAPRTWQVKSGERRGDG